MKMFLRSFSYAGRGFLRAVQTERNFRFHLCAALYVFIFSLFYSFEKTEYILLCILVGGTLALELVNSAIERVVDKASPEINVLAGMAKDMAAGAVLVFSIVSAVCGVLLFWDTEVFGSIYVFFIAHIPLLLLLIASLVFCWFFVFRLFKKGKI